MKASVVIPTFNRWPILKRTLKALSEQSLDATAYEVIVVDDGSTDSTRDGVWKLQGGFPTRLHYCYQPNQKQGTARNLGARQAAGERILFLGDDVVPHRNLLREHLAAVSDKRNAQLVVIGYTTWPSEMTVTPLLDYLGEQGWQFGFSLIDDPDDVPFNYFYTSNLSIDRGFFLDSGGFDESFQEYGWEDIELAYRLEARGMRIIYRSSAVGFHHHPMNFEGVIARQRRVGASAWKFFRLHPEMSDFLGIDRAPHYGFLDRLRLELMRTACRLSERFGTPDLSRFYPHLMTYFYVQGLRREQQREWK